MKKYLLAIPFLLFISCGSSNDNDIDTPPASPKKIISVYKDGKLYLKVNYNAGKLSGYTQFIPISNSSVVQQNVVIEYDGDKAVKYNSFDANNVLKSYQLFTYTGKLITKREFYNVNSSNQSILTIFSTYINDATKAQNNIKEISYYDSSGSLTNNYKINYINDLGSSYSDVYNSSNIKTTVQTWIKDDKIAWNSFLDPFTYQNQHNLLTRTDKNLSTGVESGYNAQYTYDSSGYPLTAKYTYLDGKIENYTFNWE